MYTHIFISNDDHWYSLIIIIFPHNLSSQLFEAVPTRNGVNCKQGQKAISFCKRCVTKQQELLLSCRVYDLNIMVVKAILYLGYVAFL